MRQLFLPSSRLTASNEYPSSPAHGISSCSNPHRALLGQRCDVPQGLGSIGYNLRVATLVYLDHQENLGWDLVNYQLW